MVDDAGGQFDATDPVAPGFREIQKLAGGIDGKPDGKRQAGLRGDLAVPGAPRFTVAGERFDDSN